MEKLPDSMVSSPRCVKKCQNCKNLPINGTVYFHHGDNNQRASEASELSPCSCQLRFQIRIYIYICGRTSNHMRMLNNSLLGNEFIARKRYKVKTKVSIRLSIAIQYL